MNSIRFMTTRSLSDGTKDPSQHWTDSFDLPMEEIRVKESKNLHRLIIHTRIGDLIVVLHGFTKKEGKSTPQKELEIAYQRLSTIIRDSV